MTRLAFINANLFDGDTAPQGNSTVVVDEGRIAACGTRGEVGLEPDDEIYDLAGRTLMPGMISGHFHAVFHNIGAEPGAPLVEHPPAFKAYQALANAQLALRCGFTGVASAGSPLDIDAQLERAIESGLFDGPRIVPCSKDTLSSADTFMPWWLGLSAEVTPIGICDGPDELRKAVRTAAGRGARLFKMSVTGGHGIPGGERRFFTRQEVAEATAAAHDVNIRVRTHVTGKRAIMDSIEVGVDILDHCDGLDEECIAAMAENGCIMLPSLYQPLILMGLPPMFGFTPESIRREFDHVCAMLPKAVEAGVTICVGDDYGTAAAPHGDYAKELALYVEHAGIDATEVLRWATRNGAAMMGLPDELGLIEPGRRAELVIVDGDPCADIGVLSRPNAIMAVMRDGRFVTPGRPPRAERRPVEAARSLAPAA